MSGIRKVTAIVTFTNWHKATESHFEENACVEVGSRDGMVGIRDTKQDGIPDAHRPMLVATQGAFAKLLADERAIAA